MIDLTSKLREINDIEQVGSEKDPTCSMSLIRPLEKDRKSPGFILGHVYYESRSFIKHQRINEGISILKLLG